MKTGEAAAYLAGRGVTRLCHFTKFQSLSHILSSEQGIEASSSIRVDVRNQVDENRYDGELSYVCCSVEYPNSWYLKRAMERNANEVFQDWVVIYLDMEVLNQRDLKFCPCNAATGRGARIFSDAGQLSRLYAPSVFLARRKSSRTANMLPCCPTDDQAEILVKDNIPRRFLKGFAVGREEDAARVYAMLLTFEAPVRPIYVAPEVLSVAWSSMVRRGVRPTEREMTF